jgi:hypothetical protein
MNEHYKGFKFEALDIIKEYKLDFLEGNVLKYLLRHRRKGGVEDLVKARYYLDEMINNYSQLYKKDEK